MSKLFVSKVEFIDGQLAILYPPGLLDSLDLKHDQYLIWEIDENIITIKKKIEESINVK